ncbi:hypothetical protein D9M72_304970 [compost metagenome]
MKIDMVKPIPARQPISPIQPQVIPGGRLHQPMRTMSQLLQSTPRGLPSTRASAAPENTCMDAPSPRSMPSRLTPALARANNGITR